MENDIRKPDAAIIDRLFENDFTQRNRSRTEEYDIRRILEQSEDEFEFQYAILESKAIEKEREERKKHFARFLSKIKQFAKIDKSNEGFYLELIQHIELYERGGVQFVCVCHDFFMKFIITLDNMRISSEEKNRLHKFIQLETR